MLYRFCCTIFFGVTFNQKFFLCSQTLHVFVVIDKEKESGLY